MKISTLSLTLAALASLPAVAAQASTPDQAEGPVWSQDARLLIGTLRLLRNEEHAPLEELARDLEGALASELPLVVRILATTLVPGLVGPDEAADQKLSEVQTELILLSAGRLSPTALERLLPVEADAPQDPDSRRARLQLLGASGNPAVLARILELAEPRVDPDNLVEGDGQEAPAAQVDPSLLLALRHAVTHLLTSNASAYTALQPLQRELHPALLSEVLFAIGNAGDARGKEILSETLAWRPELASEAMAQLRRLEPGGDAHIDEELVERLRPLLDAEQPQRSGLAALALAELGDLDVLEEMIPLLASEDAGLRGTTHFALKRLTGLTLPGSHSSWERWYASESTWMSRDRPRAFQRLCSDDPAKVAAALREILPHRLARDEFVETLAFQLESRNVTIRQLVCRTLGELEGDTITTLLMAALEDPASSVRAEAIASLTRCTGLELPADPLECLALLEERGYGGSGATPVTEVADAGR